MTAMDRTAVDCILALRVAEALPKDVGRGVVRLDPYDLEQLGVAVGEVVRISAQQLDPDWQRA